VHTLVKTNSYMKMHGETIKGLTLLRHICKYVRLMI